MSVQTSPLIGQKNDNAIVETDGLMGNWDSHEPFTATSPNRKVKSNSSTNELRFSVFWGCYSIPSSN